jgi:riboflavin kinase / FMN adenylyltransferase
MRLVNNLEEDLKKLPRRPLSIAAGNFDGLHLGHQAVIGRARDIAGQQGWASAVFTFRQHPRSVLQPGKPPLLLMRPEEKIRRIERMGIEVLIHLDFTMQLAALSAEEFISHLLCEQLHMGQIVVGENYRFGKNRRGCPEMLRALGHQLGFRVATIPPVQIGGQVVSSTAIRNLLREGRVREAAVYLNHDYQITGQVVQGDKRGRQLGFPTANLKTDLELIPADGVYAARAVLGRQRWPAMVNIGRCPTFGDSPFSRMECHIIGFQGDLYGRTLTVHFVERIRDEQMFENLQALGKRLREDQKKTLEILGSETKSSKESGR